MEKAKAYLAPHFALSRRGWLAKAAVALFLIATGVFLVYVFGELDVRPAKDAYEVHGETTGASPFVREGDVLSASFVSPFPVLRELKVTLDRGDEPQDVTYVVRIYEEDQLLQVMEFNAQDAPDVHNLLNTPIVNAQGKRYRLEITVGSTQENSASRFALMPAGAGFFAAAFNGEALPGALAMDLNSPPSSGASTFVVLLVLLCLCIAAAVFLLGKNPALNALVLILAFGFFFSMLIPVGDAPDELAHYQRAESVSRGQLFLYNDDTALFDANMMSLFEQFDGEQGVRFSDAAEYAQKAGVSTMEREAGSAGNYIFIAYVAPALGLLAARMFHLPALAAVFLCRMLNVMLYAGLCFLAVNLAPKFKTSLSVLACFPFCVSMAASFNSDVVTYALAFLLAGLLLRGVCAADGTLGAGYVAALAGVCAALVLTKVLLAGMLLLVLLVPAKKMKNGRRLWLGIAMAGVCGLVVLWLATSGAPGLREIGGADTGGQLRFLFQNPAMGVRIILRSFFQDLGSMLPHFFSLGWINYLYTYWSIPFLFASYFLFTSEYNPRNSAFAIWQKVLLGGVFVLTLLLTYWGMYITSCPVGATYVAGVQGRYFIGLLPLVPLLLCRPNPQKPQAFVPLAFSAFACSGLVVAVSTMIFRQYM